MSVDINAFPPELPPEPRPDTDDVGGDELDRAQTRMVEPQAAESSPAASRPQTGMVEPQTPNCDYCGGPAALGVYYLADQTKEWVCYPCHATMIAQALNVAADAEQAGDQVEAPA